MRPSLPRSGRGRTALALGVAGLALATAAGAAWLWRMPLADAALRGALRGVDSDFELTAVDLGGATLKNVRLGPEAAPDAVAEEAQARIGWSLFGPRLTGVRLKSPQLRIRLDQRGVSLGALDRFRGEGGEAPGRLPPMRIEIVDGKVLLLTPAGAIPAVVTAHGRLTHDFTAVLEVPPTTGADRALQNVRGVVRAQTVNRVLRVTAEGGADAVASAGFSLAALQVAGGAEIPEKLAGASARLTLGAAQAGLGAAEAKGMTIDATLAPAAGARWSLRAETRADAFTGPAGGARSATATITALGDFGQAYGEWSVRGLDNRLSDFSAAEAGAHGEYTFDGRAAKGPALAAKGSVTIPAASLGPRGRAAVLRSIPSMGGSPIGPLMGSGKDALDRALSSFSTAAAITFDWRQGAGRISLPGPLSVDATTGARVTIAPLETGRPVFAALLPSGDFESKAQLTTEGGGLPPATLTLTRLRAAGGTIDGEGAIAVTNWRAADGLLDLAATTFTLHRDPHAGVLSLNGAVTLAGKTPSLSVDDFRAPLRLAASWGGGFRVTLPDRCFDAATDGLAIPGHKFAARTVRLCTGPDNVLVGADAQGAMFGGFSTEAVVFTGRTDDRAARPASLAVQRIDARFVGPRSDGHLEISATAPRYVVDFAPDRRIRFEGAVLTARTAPGGRMTGAFRGGVLEDPALPAFVTNVSALWRAGPEGGRTVVRLDEGRARVTDKPVIAEGSATVAPADWRPRFNPMQVTGAEGALSDGKIVANGDILLEAGARPLATFTAHHDLARGEGRAQVVNPALQFTPQLDLYEITELARGVVNGVEGPMGVHLDVAWDRTAMTSSGRLSPRDVKLSAAALGPVDGISGDVDLDNLFALTTPPHQRLSIRQLNPGVVVQNGELTFQVLGPERVQIERARWPFASGELAVDPQLIVIGDDHFKMNLTLRDVDVEQLLRQLAFKDLTATGRVEGAFPLEFDRTGGRVVHGELHASSAGGTIRYIGNAGAGLAGAPQIAFDALKSFRYDNLVIELDGDLDGDIVSAIRFSGENEQPIGGIVTGDAIPVPGVERIKVTGWPFRFTVSVRAPFRRLMQTSEGIQDARSLVNEALKEEDGPPATPPQPGTPVDRPPPAPR